jgi:hypothetical protein
MEFYKIFLIMAILLWSKTSIIVPSKAYKILNMKAIRNPHVLHTQTRMNIIFRHVGSIKTLKNKLYSDEKINFQPPQKKPFIVSLNQ